MKTPKTLLLSGTFLLTLFTFSSATHAAEVSAWIPSWGVEDAVNSLEENKDTIDTLSPFWYHVNGDGTLSLTQAENSENQAIIAFAKENNIPLIPTISNSFDGKKISGFLNDEIERAKNIQNIVDKVLEFDYDGIDIDYEGSQAADIDAFSAYIKALDEALELHGKKLTIAVMAKSYAMMPIFGERGQDWKELSKYVDEFRIMTYDYGWSGSAPRPVAPYYWVEEVVKYAVDQVPLEKIRLGVPFYGYAWSDNKVEGGKEFYSYTHGGILGILEKYGVDLQYDPAQRTNKFFYLSENDERDPVAPFEIWFENRASLQAKLELVKKYNLGGIAIWRLGREDKDNWPLIRQMVKDEPKVEIPYFSDVSARTLYADSIQRLAFLGLVKGQGTTGLFDPTSLVNRAEILKMSLNSFAVNTSPRTFPQVYTINTVGLLSPFPDVSDSAWYQAYVKTAVDEKIIEGYPDGTFKPGNDIIRVEALKLALESAGVDLSSYPTSTWYLPYQNWAIDHGLYTSADFVPGDQITRAEAAYIIAKVIEVLEKEARYSVFNTKKI